MRTSILRVVQSLCFLLHVKDRADDLGIFQMDIKRVAPRFWIFAPVDEKSSVTKFDNASGFSAKITLSILS